MRVCLLIVWEWEARKKTQLAKFLWQDDKMDNTKQIQIKSGTEAVIFCSLKATFELRGLLTQQMASTTKYAK